MGQYSLDGCNFKIPSNQCTLQTCCIQQSNFDYRVDFAGNLFFAIYFAVFIIPQLAVGIKFRTWGFMVGMLLGLILEVVGYIARVLLHHNPFNKPAFLCYLIVITIAPVFLSAGIYLCLTRIMVIYGEHNSRLRPAVVATTFMTSDFLSLVLQAAGGGLADVAKPNTKKRQHGVDVMIAGLILQAVSLTAFLLVCTDFAVRCSRGSLDNDPEKRRVRGRAYFKAFLAALVLSTVTILIRSIFRVAELWEGFTGSLWNNQTDFMVLDGAMIAIAALCLMLFHPGLAFGGFWEKANWSFKKSNGPRRAEKGQELLNIPSEDVSPQ